MSLTCDTVQRCANKLPENDSGGPGNEHALWTVPALF